MQKETKINQILQRLPHDAVATTKWLRSYGISRSHVTCYVKSGWLDRIGVGAVARRGRRIEWPGAVYALQSQLGLSVHPAGKTALGLLGALHYVPLGKVPVQLFCRNREHIPQWFRKHDWDVKIDVVRSDLFGNSGSLGMSDVTMGDFSIKVSSRERAMMEYLDLLKGDDAGDEPVKIMEGLASLRPGVIQSLLEACRSAKVKRLFLVLAENADHPWLKKLYLKKVNTGAGKRQFVNNGYLSPRFEITVPRSWRSQEQEA